MQTQAPTQTTHVLHGRAQKRENNWSFQSSLTTDAEYSPVGPTYDFHVFGPGDAEVEEVRRTQSTALGRYYEGWSDEYDRQFDRHTVSFALRGSGGDAYLATCRIMVKHLDGRSVAVPMETGDLSRFVIPDSQRLAVEGGGVSFQNGTAARHLMYAVGQWLARANLGPIYTTYDVRNPLIRRFYTRTLGFRIIPDAMVAFSSFRYRNTNEPVQWQVVVQDGEEFAELRKRLEQMDVIPERIRHAAPPS